MKKRFIIVGLVLGFWLAIFSMASAEVIGNARLGLIQGDVVIQTPDTGTDWGVASVNTPLVPGMKLWVPEGGKAEVQFVGGPYLRADGNTEVDVTTLKIDNQENITQMGLPQGRTYVYYPGSGVRNSVFQVDTPVASVKAYGASRFMVDVYENGYTEVSAISGSVYVESQSGNATVDAGNMLSLGSDQTAEISPVRQDDAWAAWNRSRDSAIAQVGSSRKYLPPTLATYGSDLDSNGRWIYAADSGYVWNPSQVAVDWAPYRAGRWCWIGGDYVWVSYEPWGWVPYHYGRWSFVTHIGWCWVPPALNTYYWGPGYVAWIGTSSFVSWVPLAPGEVYYGHGYYGPFSVNIANINIIKVKVTDVYVNAYVKNGVTVVGRETFLTGRPEGLVNVPANPFREGLRPSIGRPDIRPVRATALPMPTRVVLERVLPPREIAQRVARVEHRPVAVNREVSVFKPGERVASMPTRKAEHPPAAAIQRVQRPELGRPSTERRVAVTPPVRQPEVRGHQREQAGPVHREFGQAPAFNGGTGRLSSPGGQQIKPPVQRQETARPPQHQEKR